MVDAALLMEALSKRFGGKFTLREGVCSLGNSQHQEVVVIEMPAGEGSVLLHCMMRVPGIGPQAWRQILEMNLPSAMNPGGWLALDNVGELRLCSLMPKMVLSEVVFCDWVAGFMKAALEMRDRLTLFLSPCRLT